MDGRSDSDKIRLLGVMPHCSLLEAVHPDVCAYNVFFCFSVSFLPVVYSPLAASASLLLTLLALLALLSDVLALLALICSAVLIALKIVLLQLT
jgi:hypothetical protein